MLVTIYPNTQQNLPEYFNFLEQSRQNIKSGIPVLKVYHESAQGVSLG